MPCIVIEFKQTKKLNKTIVWSTNLHDWCCTYHIHQLAENGVMDLIH